MLQNDNGLALALQLRQRLPESLHGLHVEVCGRLVEDVHGRPHRVAGGDGHHLHLPARETEHAPVPKMLDSHAPKRVLDPLQNLGSRQSCVHAAERHLARRVGHEELAAGVLEDRADQLPDFPDVELARIRSSDSGCSVQLALVEMGDEPVDEAGDRGLPAPAPSRQE